MSFFGNGVGFGSVCLFSLGGACNGGGQIRRNEEKVGLRDVKFTKDQNKTFLKDIIRK